MPDALDDVLRLVAEGRLTADEAAPIIAALERPGHTTDEADRHGPRPAFDPPSTGRPDDAPGPGGRAVRLEVFEDGHRVVNLRLPAALGSAAMLRVPGLSSAQVERIRTALADGVRGTLLEAGDDDGRVRIVID